MQNGEFGASQNVVKKEFVLYTEPYPVTIKVMRQCGGIDVKVFCVGYQVHLILNVRQAKELTTRLIQAMQSESDELREARELQSWLNKVIEGKGGE